MTVRYPKLAASIDELLSKMVKEQGEELLTMAVRWAIAEKDAARDAKMAEPVEEKLPPIPVTKEEVLDGH